MRDKTNYSCLMLKTQKFSSLFRHYAKYHGLRKEELEYSFVNVLAPEDTPELVQLQRSDVITVRKKQKEEVEKGPKEDDEEFRKDMMNLLDDEEHMDALFVFENGATVPAHKTILTARGEYFKGLFRKGCFADQDGKITVDSEFSERIITLMLEFLYTNRIDSLPDCSAQEIVDLLHLSNKWQLRDLKKVCEYQAMEMICVENVGKMFYATEEFQAQRLKKACVKFIMENIKEVTADQTFIEEVKLHPQLIIPILRDAAERMEPGGEF